MTAAEFLRDVSCSIPYACFRRGPEAHRLPGVPEPEQLDLAAGAADDERTYSRRVGPPSH